MKTNKLSIPLSMTVALAGLIVCAVSCAKKGTPPEKNPAPPPEPLPTNTVSDNTTNTVDVTNTPPAPVEAAPVVTNVPPAVPQDITNPPPAETTTKAPETIQMTETNVPGHAEVVEMPTNAPVAPTNFYPTAITTNSTSSSSCCLSPAGGGSSTNFFLRFRAGYEYINHGDNNSAYSLGAKFYAYGDGLRESAGKNGWLIPDADAEITSQYLPKTDQDAHPGSDNGVSFRADFTWPWVHWTSLMFARSNSVCPFCQPLALGLGPTVNLGFDHLYNESKYRFARYAGVRLTFNRSGFIEYTVGDTIGLGGTRQQIVTEIPFYESRDGEVRYYLRGLWNRGESTKPDVLEGGVFLEMPFSTLVMPCKWGDLVPFAQ
jgi:hypothetical protein